MNFSPISKIVIIQITHIMKKNFLLCFFTSVFFLMSCRNPVFNSFWIIRLYLFCLSSFLLKSYRKHFSPGAENILEKTFCISAYIKGSIPAGISFYLFNSVLFICNYLLLQASPYSCEISIHIYDVLISFSMLLFVNGFLEIRPVNKYGKQRQWPWAAGLAILLILPA